MPVTAPDVSVANPQYYRVSFHFIDANGDVRTDSVNVPFVSYSTTTIQAYAVALGAVTNSNLYAISATAIWQAAKSRAGATDAVRVSVDDNVVNLLKSLFGDTARNFIPAPIDAIFTPETENPATDNVALNLVITTFDEMIEGVGGQYTWVSSRFSERRDINESIKP